MTNNATQISQVNKNEIIKSTTVTTHRLNFLCYTIPTWKQHTRQCFTW